MAESPKRRLLDHIGSAPTFVAAGCRLTGDVETNGPVVVCGSIQGDGRIGGALNMATHSRWHGDVQARQAVIAGELVGRIVVEDKLEIGATAVIRAQVIARSIAIAKGAVIEGEVIVTSGEPVINFEEKRAAQ